MASLKRIAKEMADMKRNPPWGISCDFADSTHTNHLEAVIIGPRDSPYEQGTFTLCIDIPDRYPFEPPQIKFVTPVYHPNVDKGGRICLDLIKMPPKGDWRPVISLENVLLAVQSLLASPNPDDPLMIDIAMEYKQEREKFNKSAAEFTKKYAKGKLCD